MATRTNYPYSEKVPEYEIFSKRLRAEINKNHYTLGRFADELGIGETTLSDFVRARRMPSAFTLKQMCILLKVSADYLLELEDKL